MQISKKHKNITLYDTQIHQQLLQLQFVRLRNASCADHTCNVSQLSTTALPKNTPVGFTETFKTSDGFITPRLTPSKTSDTWYPAGLCIPRSDNLTVTLDGIASAELNTTNAQLPFGAIGFVHNWIVPNWNKHQLHTTNRNTAENTETYQKALQCVNKVVTTFDYYIVRSSPSPFARLEHAGYRVDAPFNPWRSLVPSGCVKSVERTACVCQSCDVTCVFSQGAEDDSIPEELWVTLARWILTNSANVLAPYSARLRHISILTVKCPCNV